MGKDFGRSSQLEISAKKLENKLKIDHLKPILFDFMNKSENFEQFLINLADIFTLERKIFGILNIESMLFEETLKDVEKKLEDFAKQNIFAVESV